MHDTTSNNGLRGSIPTEINGSAEHRILIVDDTAGIHEDFRKILLEEETTEFDQAQAALFGADPAAPSQKHFHIDSALQGKKAIELVEQAMQAGTPYVLAFVDIRMPPGLDGIETAKRLWEVDPRLQIVICTAYSDYSWKDMAASFGYTDNLVFLKKPFERIEILQLVHALTAKSELSIQVRRRMEELDSLVAQRTQELRLANEELIKDIAKRKATEIRLSAFAALGRRLSEAQTAKAAAGIIVEVADQLLGWDSCVCHSYSPTQDCLVQLLCKDTIDGVRKECECASANHKPSGLHQKAIEEGGQLVLREKPSSEVCANFSGSDEARAPASILCVPIRNGAHVIGVLSIQSKTHHAYNRHSLETLQALADHCGGVLNRIRSEEILNQTEQQLRQSQKMEAIGLLAGGVAHDFNNLLAVILGNAELGLENAMQSGNNDTENLDEILTAAKRAAKLTKQLLAFGRKQAIFAKPLNLNQLIPQMSEMLKRIIGLEVQLQCTYEENLPLIHADSGMLDQVVMNLVVNARDAMPGGGQIDISTQAVDITASQLQKRPEAQAGRFVCLSVKDTGTGISPKDLSRIFEPFFTTKELGKGTGLGLSTVFGIIKQHQGWVEVSSTVGVGTTFQIYIPALESNECAPTQARTSSTVRGGNQVILLVDDESSVRRVSRQFLETAGYRLLEASSGPEALEIWSKHANEIDLLLTDIAMPGEINGRVLAGRLTASKPNLKVIFMSGYAGDMASDQVRIDQNVHNRFLQKPCVGEDLLRLVRDALDEDANFQGKPS